MSGNQPPDDSVPEGAAFPAIGQYDVVPGPGDADYVEPPPDQAEDEPLDTQEVDFEEPPPDLVGLDAGEGFPPEIEQEEDDFSEEMGEEADEGDDDNG